MTNDYSNTAITSETVQTGGMLDADIQVRNLELALATAKEENRKLVQKKNSAVENERKAFASELHDEINASIVSLKYCLRTILGLTEQTPNEATIAQIKKIAKEAFDGAQLLYLNGRNLARRLRPEALSILGIKGAVEDIICQHNKMQSGCQFTFRAEGDLSCLDGEMSIAVYRIIQESLSNASKHANAHYVSVVVVYKSEVKELEIDISDDGVGFNLAALTQGIGLIGIHERVHSFEGSIDVQTRTGKGTQISIKLLSPTNKAD